MKNGSFSARLQKVMREGNLTGADLARWFERPDPTVRCWIKGTKPMRGASLDIAYVEAKLAKLETMLAKRRGLPVPRLTPTERIKHVNGLKSTT